MKNLLPSRLAVWVFLAAGLTIPVGCSRRPSGSLAPADALKSFKLSEDFRVELFAAEPAIVDPVDMVFDEQGRAFVAEMLDLPDDPPKGQPARGRIRMLEDIDGDGRADKSVIFAENTLHASGLFPWKGGLIVPASPDILYFKDTNGDGKADVRQVLFTGFFHGNPEAQISNPRLAVDNWIYFSNTGNAGEITSPAHPGRPPLQLRGFDFRYDPVRGRYEPASGDAQFGSTFDDWGNRFISQNTTHLRHIVLPFQYLARAPMLEVPRVWNDPYGKLERLMYPITQPQHWRVVRTKLRQEHYDELKTGRIEHVAGHITGAAGSTIYNGDAFPPGYAGSIFTGDVSGNLVRRDIVIPDGVSFRAHPAKEGVEFLASSDQWFRPTCFANAPDGNLYMMDMQREFIETPLSVPEELRKQMDFYSGDTLGRIYRIVPTNPRVKRGLKTDLGAASSAQLVGYLEHANGWHRQTAQRLLLERQDASIADALERSATASKVPQARLHALYLLDSLGKLEAPLVAQALADPQPQIREHAIRLTERFPALEASVLKLAGDKEPRIQFQLSLSLGNFKSAAARAALVDVAARNESDPWIRTAALSSVADSPGAFFQSLVARTDGRVTKEMASAAGSLIGSRKQTPEISAFIASLARTPNADAGLAGLARGLKLASAARLKATGMEAALTRYLNAGLESAWDVARYFEISALIDRAARDAVSAALDPKSRVRAIAALRGATAARALPIVDQILKSAPPAAVQAAAVLAASSFESPDVGKTLLAHWKSYAPEARTSAIGALMATRDRIPALLDALESNLIETSAVEAGARARLFEDSDTAISSRARKIFASAAGGRAAVVARFRDVLKLSGQTSHGKQLFEDACAKCHLARRQGTRVGPDLSGISVKTKEELLEAILNPSASIEPRYVNYLVTTKDGRMYDGVLAGETPGAVTLRGGSEEDVTILRTNIAEIRSSAISLMPEDLEQNLSKQDLADLIAYLRGGL